MILGKTLNLDILPFNHGPFCDHQKENMGELLIARWYTNNFSVLGNYQPNFRKSEILSAIFNRVFSLLEVP